MPEAEVVPHPTLLGGVPFYRHVRVVEVVRETSDAISLVLEPAQDAPMFAYRPGQFLTFRIHDGDDRHVRCYSLASAPGIDSQMMVTVKRVAGGRVSNWLCDHAIAGLELEVLPPGGSFTPASLDDDLLLIAGGSGITPVMSILRAALREGSGRIALFYANRDEQAIIFRDPLNALAREYPGRLTIQHWLESVQGLPQADLLQPILAPWAASPVFLCGPDAFMEAATQALVSAGVPRKRIHAEKFLSLTKDPTEGMAVQAPAAGRTAELDVTLDGRTELLEWPVGRKLLDVLLDADIVAPHSCREGMCSACTCRVLEGEVTMDKNAILEPRDLAEGWVLSCQARAASPHVRVTFD